MFKAFREGLSPKAKSTIVVILAIVVVVGSIVGYKVWDYKENNPKFCAAYCHLMDSAYAKWESSAHKDVNCHECHHLSLYEQNMLMVTLILHNPKEVAQRHGKVIVPAKFCTKCHVDKNEKFPNAIKITESPFHKKHFNVAQLECTKCHGYKTHEFTPEPTFCIGCHEKNKEVHGMAALACMSCHTDRTDTFKPNRDVCLSCHGSDAQRAEIAKKPCQPTMKQCPPAADQVAKASKMSTFPEDGAMQFECSKCHQPHGLIKPTLGVAFCITADCHKGADKKGKHPMHLENGLKCNDCHKAHMWKVSKAILTSAKCTACHPAGNPANFLK